MSLVVIAGLLGMLGWGLSDLVAKKTIDDIGDVKTLVLAHFFGVGGVLLIALVEIGRGRGSALLPTSSSTLGWLALFGVLQALVYVLVYTGFGKGQVAVLNPIFSSYSGLVALVSIAVFGESVTRSLAAALAVTFFGVLLMNLDIASLRSRRIVRVIVPGFTHIAMAVLLATVWTLGWSRLVGDESGAWLSNVLWMYLAMSVALVLYAVVRSIGLGNVSPAAWRLLALIGLFEMLAYVAVSWGYQANTSTSVVAVLSGAFSLPTIVGARVWLREKTTSTQLVGSLTIVAGIVLVAWFS